MPDDVAAALELSLRVASVSILVIGPPAIALAYVMARRSFPGRDLLAAILGLPLVLPPTAIGLLLLRLFGANGPLSDPPANFVWVREARLEFFATASAEPAAIRPAEVNLEVERLDPRIDRIVPQNPKLWKLAEGFQFTEGPLWVPERKELLFSDPNANRIYAYDPAGDGALRVFRERSGYDGVDVGEYAQPGSNGLARNPRSGALTIAEHGRIDEDLRRQLRHRRDRGGRDDGRHPRGAGAVRRVEQKRDRGVVVGVAE